MLAALELRIPLHEAEPARLAVTENLDAWSAYHLGLQHMYRFNRGDNAAARRALRARDRARSRASRARTRACRSCTSRPPSCGTRTTCAARSSRRAAAPSAASSSIRSTRSSTSRWAAASGSKATSTAACAWLERATAISPNYAQGIYARAWTEALSGRGREGREHVDLAMRAEPARSAATTRCSARARSPTSSRRGRGGGRLGRARGALARRARADRVIAAPRTADGRPRPARTRGRRTCASATRRSRAQDFFRSFPMNADAMRARVSGALARLGF